MRTARARRHARLGAEADHDVHVLLEPREALRARGARLLLELCVGAVHELERLLQLAPRALQLLRLHRHLELEEAQLAGHVALVPQAAGHLDQAVAQEAHQDDQAERVHHRAPEDLGVRQPREET